MQQETAILDRYGLLGYPVSHSKSPVIHRLFAEQTDQPISYELVEVAPDKLDSIVRSFQRNGGRGLNVTVPHKAAVTRLVDELSEAASIAGAVNTLEISSDEIIGHNTDG
ncbi:MAG: shikimate dehydrogenase, partial [Pseudomonadota bacterium]